MLLLIVQSIVVALLTFTIFGGIIEMHNSGVMSHSKIMQEAVISFVWFSIILAMLIVASK